MNKIERWQTLTYVLAGLCAMLAAAAIYNREEARRLGAMLKNTESKSCPAPIEKDIVCEIARQKFQPEPRNIPTTTGCHAEKMDEKTKKWICLD